MDWQESDFNGSKFGLYLHVPFCKMFCSFCPFYKVLYDENLKKKYIEGVKSEVKLRGLKGNASWIYIGGGTPNLLKAEEICEILAYLREFMELNDVGMEGNSFEFTPEYLEKIGDAGVTKISIGVETFQSNALKAVKRAKANEGLVDKIVDKAQRLGISVNIDLMVGLPEQSLKGCLKDVETIASVGPDQVTIYPYLLIQGVMATPSANSQSMFKTIESAWNILKENGYKRESVWVFAKSQSIYDSAKDELVSDYFGLGPAAFGTFGNIQTVNPPIELYLNTLRNSKRLAFYTELDEKAKTWRTFAHELYKLQLDPTVCNKLPLNIGIILRLLRATGYVKGFNVTDKGRYLVHEITKTVVETLPFPLSNPNCIRNISEYEEIHKKVKLRDA
ncbi:radical SAM protein [Candidatus Bathyarchaeota archaeon]|nr:radical SAM protein [Candidatus Bathyarchaeota archaeon]